MPKPRRSAHSIVARRLGLTIIDADRLTIERRKRGKGFAYVHARTGRAVATNRLAQIEAMVLPPAWTDVRIAPAARAHLQAVGRDAKARVQYRYHDDWAQVRDAVKVERLIRFGRALPAIRDAVNRDMNGDLRARDTVVATAVRLIDNQLVRVGNEQYARDGTRGASTLRGDNAKLKGGRVEIAYRAKAGKPVSITLKDRRLAKRIARLKKARRGRRLFAYRGPDGTARSVSSRQINTYLAEVSGAPVTAKDFRTFAACSMALEQLCTAAPRTQTRTARKREEASVMRSVAERLRNTPAVTRSSYVHPAIVQAFHQMALDPGLVKGRRRNALSKAETGLMRFLESQRGRRGWAQA